MPSIFSKRWPEAFKPISRIVSNVVVTSLGPVFINRIPIFSTLYRYPYSMFKGIFFAFGSCFRKPPVRLADGISAAFIHSQWTQGYYHWMTEALPRAVAVQRDYRDYRVLIPQSYNSFHPRSLELLGLNFDFFPTHNISLSKACVTSCAKHYSTTDPKLLRDLRFRLTRGCKKYQSGEKRRVYISRKKSRGRVVVNEGEVMKLLKKYHFDEIFSEDLSFSDQVELFSRTSLLVSIHGAGLTNMMFMDGQSSVLELLPFRNGFFDLRRNSLSIKHDPCYFQLAKAMGHNYDYLECDHDRGRFSKTNLANITVDCSLLETKIERFVS